MSKHNKPRRDSTEWRPTEPPSAEPLSDLESELNAASSPFASAELVEGVSPMEPASAGQGEGGTAAQVAEGETPQRSRPASQGVGKEDVLRESLNDNLIEGLGENLRNCLDDSLERGMTHQQLLLAARQITGGKTAHRGGLVYLGIEAYLEKKAREQAKPAIAGKTAGNP